MKKTLFGIAAFATLIAAPAFAADLSAPYYKAPPPPPVWSWTGFYIGLNGGYGWNQSTGDLNCYTPAGVLNGTGCNSPLSGTVSPGGGLFGAQAGYNWQTGPVVFGLETDIQVSGIKGSGSVTDPCCSPTFTTPGTFTDSSNLDWFGTFRGRVGFAAGNKALLYATGGLIYGRETVSSTLTFPLVSYPMSAASTRTGGTVGAGVEYAFTPSLSAKVEGLYYDMGSLTDSFTSPVTGFMQQTTYHFRGTIIRGGLNWHFGGGPMYGSD